MKQYIQSLIRATEFFEISENYNKTFKLNSQEYTISDIKLLAFFTLFNYLSEYKFYTQKDFEKITLVQFEQELKRVNETLTEDENVPSNIAEMVANMERDQAKVKQAISKEEGEFKEWSNIVELTVAKRGEEDYPDKEESEEIIRVARTDPDRFIHTVANLIKQENEEISETLALSSATSFTDFIVSQPIKQDIVQIIPKIDTQKVASLKPDVKTNIIQIALIPKEIEEAAKIITLPQMAAGSS